MSLIFISVILCLVVLSVVFGVLYFTKKCTPDCTKCTPDCTKCTPDPQWRTSAVTEIDPNSKFTGINISGLSSSAIKCLVSSNSYDAVSFSSTSDARMCKNPDCIFIPSNIKNAQTYINSSNQCKFNS
jgi:hypothetical protein